MAKGRVPLGFEHRQDLEQAIRFGAEILVPAEVVLIRSKTKCTREYIDGEPLPPGPPSGVQEISGIEPCERALFGAPLGSAR